MMPPTRTAALVVTLPTTSFSGGQTDIYASDSKSLIDLSALPSLQSNVSFGAPSYLQATNSGTILDGKLASISYTTLSIDGTGTEATAQIAGSSFALYTQQDGAWIKNGTEEAKMVDAMRGGDNAVVKGVSAKGTQSTDSFSLKGVSQALDRVAQECK